MASTWCILLLLVAGLAFVVAEQALEQTQEDEPVATRKLHAASLIIPLLSTVGGFLSAMTGILPQDGTDEFEQNDQYVNKGVFLMNRAHTGRCLELGLHQSPFVPTSEAEGHDTGLAGLVSVSETCHGTRSQRFHFKHSLIIGKFGDVCLAVSAKGNIGWVPPCLDTDGNDDVRWKVERFADGSAFILRSKTSSIWGNHCVVSNMDPVLLNQTNLKMEKCPNISDPGSFTPNMKWYLPDIGQPLNVNSTE